MMDHHRQLYIFSAHTRGIRISDLLRWRRENFTGEHLYFQIKKIGDDLSIGLPQKSREVIHYYRKMAVSKLQKDRPDPESFIFPLLKVTA